MTNTILRQSLTSALDLDCTLREWALPRLNLSPRAQIEQADMAGLRTSGFGDADPDFFFLAHNHGSTVGVHVIPALSSLPEGLGKRACARAQTMIRANAPARHDSIRVALIAPPALVRHNWQAAREFPYWIDFDAFTKRQIDQRAA